MGDVIEMEPKVGRIRSSSGDVVTAVIMLGAAAPALGLLAGLAWRGFRWAAGW